MLFWLINSLDCLCLVVVVKPKVMEFEVKALIETVNSIHDEMFYLRDR